MHVDLPGQHPHHQGIAKARRKARPRAATLLQRRQRVDERFDPIKALAGTARYLRVAQPLPGARTSPSRADHMGIGNLQQCDLAAFGAGDDTPYAQLYFDSSRPPPGRLRQASSRLGDDSANLLVPPARRQGHPPLWRAPTRPSSSAGRRLQDAVRTRRGTCSTRRGRRRRPAPRPTSGERGGRVLLAADARRLRGAGCASTRAWASSPQARRVGARSTARCGRGPRRAGLHRRRRARVRRPRCAHGHQHGARQPLPAAAGGRDIEATPNYSLHTTGCAFDIERHYTAPRQAYAFQFFLDRLQALNLIAWVREPGAIHVTASRDAAALEPALHRLGLGR